MTRELLIQKTLNSISKLPQEKVNEVADFVDYILKKYDEEVMMKGVEKLVSQSTSMDFIKNDEDLYSLADLKEKF